MPISEQKFKENICWKRVILMSISPRHKISFIMIVISVELADAHNFQLIS